MSAPIPMLLFCPNCQEQHVDEPQPEKDWTNPPHRSHECQFCGHVWRPADVPTTGVLKLATAGKADKSPRPVCFANGKDFAEAVAAVWCGAERRNSDTGTQPKVMTE